MSQDELEQRRAFLTRKYRQQILLLAAQVNDSIRRNNYTKREDVLPVSLSSPAAVTASCEGSDQVQQQRDEEMESSQSVAKEPPTPPPSERKSKVETNDVKTKRTGKSWNKAGLPPSFFVAEYMMKKLHQSWKSEQESARTGSNNNKGGSAFHRNNNNNYDPSEKVLRICSECGSIVQPGWNGTTLRVVRPNRNSKKRRKSQMGNETEMDPTAAKRRKKTLRRRRQRLIKRRARAQQKEVRRTGSLASAMGRGGGDGGGSIRNSNNDDNNDDDATSTNDDDNLRLVPLVDQKGYLELDRNYLVLKCGSCGANFRLKGMKHRKQTIDPNLNNSINGTTSKSNPQQQQQQQSVSTKNRNDGQENKRKWSSFSREGNLKVDPDEDPQDNEDEEGFLALPPKATTNPSRDNRNRAVSQPGSQRPRPQQQRTNMTLLDAALDKKKKKKKKKPTPKSELMEFLSSLND